MHTHRHNDYVHTYINIMINILVTCSGMCLQTLVKRWYPSRTSFIGMNTCVKGFLLFCRIIAIRVLEEFKGVYVMQ